MTQSINLNKYLKIFNLKKFFDQPEGELFDLVISFVLKKILQIITQ
jgi:hypothetical protein